MAAPVPEAKTYVMMLAGLGLVGWTTLRRRRTALQII
ncbi:MAG TPA: PEP-CTERM sorting domain-containing protein [Thiobacillus sp.]|nr:PEP-CTERM sorting domain-containing protein [Thiobacillus sp.]HQT69744.1 PEP-CTERM sorting domain-containing protein [Thiobacillus sp.]